jgi:hypothetical protein
LLAVSGALLGGIAAYLVYENSFRKKKQGLDDVEFKEYYESSSERPMKKWLSIHEETPGALSTEEKNIFATSSGSSDVPLA